MPEVVACRARRAECTRRRSRRRSVHGTGPMTRRRAGRTPEVLQRRSGPQTSYADLLCGAARNVAALLAERVPKECRASYPVAGTDGDRGETRREGCQEAAQGSEWMTSNKGVLKGRGRRRRLTIGLPAPAACGGLRCNRRQELGDRCGSRLRCDLS